jgi:hypothetical protein
MIAKDFDVWFEEQKAETHLLLREVFNRLQNAEYFMHRARYHLQEGEELQQLAYANQSRIAMNNLDSYLIPHVDEASESELIHAIAENETHSEFEEESWVQMFASHAPIKSYIHLERLKHKGSRNELTDKLNEVIATLNAFCPKVDK